MLVPWRVNDSFSCSQSHAERPAQKPCRCRACDLPGRKSFRLWLHQPETKGSNHRSGTPIWGRGGMVGFMKCGSLHWTYNMTLKNDFTYCWWKQIPVANGGISHYCCGFRISQVVGLWFMALLCPKKNLWISGFQQVESSFQATSPHRKNIYHFNKSKLTFKFSWLFKLGKSESHKDQWGFLNPQQPDLWILSPIKSTAVILIEVGQFSTLHTVDGRNLANHTGMYLLNSRIN